MKFSHGFFITLVTCASLTLHFVGLWHPQEAVFDEVHFGKFVSGYLKGEYFFDIHPPLGKLMIAGMAAVTDVEPHNGFVTIGEQYADYQYIWLRFLPAFFGSLLAPLVYLLVWRLSASRWAAILAALFVVCENALLVQSKFILIDSFLLFFGFAALYLFFQSRAFFSQGRWGLWAAMAAAIGGGFAVSVKWTAGSFMGLMLAFGLAELIRRLISRKKKEFFHALIGYSFLIVIPPLIYIAFFAVHFTLLPEKGPGNAYMTARFQQSQESGFLISDFGANFYELNQEMFRANQRITATHAYSSKWYTWPFMLRGVYYWNKDIVGDSQTLYEKIYLLGNPFVWWVSTIVVIYFFISRLFTGIGFVFSRFMKRQMQKKSADEDQSISGVNQMFLGAGYIINLLPFIFIGRVMFLYHYLTAMVFAIIITAVIITARPKPRPMVFAFLIMGAVAGFFVIFPVTYGTITHSAWPASIFWLKSWI
ncbi:MAG: phospholipid carrier-dependent glycosyltransferase [bacterium]|nr:phospholipid carrier-dependent glycosyltransferase [bacterium]